MLDASRDELDIVKQQYALSNATLVVIYIGDTANRIISGQQISEVDRLPPFAGSEGRQDVSLSIKSWIYEAQANMYSGSSEKIRTAVIADASNEVLTSNGIEPADILGNLEETYYFRKTRNNGENSFEYVDVTKIDKLKALAKAADDKALYELGLAYAAGDGVDVSYPQARMLLYKAHLRGNAEAARALSNLDDESHGYDREGKPDYDFTSSDDSYVTAKIPVIRTREDFDSLKFSAMNGPPEMQCAVADIYADDSRAEFFNVAEAAVWYEKAAEQGHSRAQWLLGLCFFQGNGFSQDLDQAEYWLNKSAQGGDADGQYTLGGFYFMKPDIVKAKYWIEKSANQGHEEAKTMLGAVCQLFTL